MDAILIALGFGCAITAAGVVITWRVGIVSERALRADLRALRTDLASAQKGVEHLATRLRALQNDLKPDWFDSASFKQQVARKGDVAALDEKIDAIAAAADVVWVKPVSTPGRYVKLGE